MKKIFFCKNIRVFYIINIAKKYKFFYKKLLTNHTQCVILFERSAGTDMFYNGGIAQLARAFGSYPTGRWFKSDFRYHIRPVGQAVKTPPFHGSNGGSIPPRVTRKEPTFVYDKCGFFSAKSVLTDGINPPAVDEITP